MACWKLFSFPLYSSNNAPCMDLTVLQYGQNCYASLVATSVCLKNHILFMKEKPSIGIHSSMLSMLKCLKSNSWYKAEKLCWRRHVELLQLSWSIHATANAFVNIISPHRKTTQDNKSTAYLPLRKVFQSWRGGTEVYWVWRLCLTSCLSAVIITEHWTLPPLVNTNWINLQ